MSYGYDRRTDRPVSMWQERRTAEPSRVIDLACGHSAQFVRPVPGIGEFAFCRTCCDYSRRTASKQEAAA